ncbi:hypothetical protein FQN55_002983 [Onygenales sp. PD_40]|nr:hypothetical protein FQN55_002983 [Onygenales sp. PD_40]
MGFDEDPPLTHEKFQDIVVQSKEDWTKNDYKAFSSWLYNLILRSGDSCKNPIEDAEIYMKPVREDVRSISERSDSNIDPDGVEDWRYFLNLALQKINALESQIKPLQDEIKAYRDLEQQIQGIGEPRLPEIPKEIDGYSCYMEKSLADIALVQSVDDPQNEPSSLG